jgi:integral membrane protein
VTWTHAGYPREVTRGALLRYRVMAYATGVLLVALVLVAMPVKYVDALGGDPHLVEVIGPIHGWLYFVYLITAFWLAVKARWGLWFTVGVLLAGTIPFASFVAERAVVHRVEPVLDELDRADVRSS